MPPLPVAIRLTGSNRYSLAAVLAVWEAELPAGTFAPRRLGRGEAWDGQGLLVMSFVTREAGAVRTELADLRGRLGDGLHTLAGGPHATADPAGTLALGFRHVSPGEAGPTSAALVAALARGERAAPGVLPRDPRLPLDRYPNWPRSLDLFCPIELTRGCPMACAFCQVPALHGTTPRHRSLAEIARIADHAVSTGHTWTRFVSPSAFAYGSADGRTPQPRQVEALLTLLHRRGLGRIYLGNFPSEVRPESVTPELLGLVRDLCANRSIVVGLQSGSPATLLRLHRGHTVEEGIRAVALIRAAGLLPRVDFIFGLPGETAEDLALTRDVIRHLTSTYDAHIDRHRFAPIGGTPLGDTVPAPIDPDTRELLEEITSRGQASGHGAVGQW
jgi:B12-binding domain/radical SAM domain protein